VIINANPHIRLISEGSCDIEDWSKDAGNTALRSLNKSHFKIYSNKKTVINTVVGLSND